MSAAQPIQCLQSKETPAAAMLAKLKAEHSAVRGCMDEMERITDQASGDRGEYVRARFQLSQASFSLRLCVEAAHQHLLARVEESGAEALRQLAHRRHELTLRSTAHVSRWTAELIERDWDAYCRASREIRGLMAISIDAERSTLYPMLERIG